MPGQQEVVWLRVRGRDGERQLRKKLRVSLRLLAGMDLAQFQQFLREKLELQRPLAVAYGDDEGDEIPVTSDSELNVMVYLAELQSRQDRPLDLRLREPPADRSLVSARQLARRAEREVAARREEMRAGRGRCELHPHRGARRRTEPREVAAEPADTLWTRVDAWQQACQGAGAEWRQQQQQQPQPQETARRERRKEVPSWFSAFMGQFQQDLVSEVVSAVRAELARGSGCLCTAPAAGSETNATSKSNDTPDTPITAQPTAVEPPAAPSAPENPGWVAQFPAPEETRADAGVQTAPPAPAPPSGSPSWVNWLVEPDHGAGTDSSDGVGSAPADGDGRSSDSGSGESAVSGATGVSAESAVSGVSAESAVSGVSSGSGRSVSGVHRGVTVYSTGGRSVETTAGCSGRPALQRRVLSEPAGRPRPRPRRQLTAAEEPDYRCMLVMLERSAAELPGPAGGGGEGGGGDAAAGESQQQQQQQQELHQPQQESPVQPQQDTQSQEQPQPQSQSHQETQPQSHQKQQQELQQPHEPRQEPRQEPPVSVAAWLASEPPMPPPPPPPPAEVVDAPEPETAVKKLAVEPEQKPQPEPEPEPELEEGFVTVNGRRLSLSEDDFSDIVIISSPGGSERFEMVEEEPEELPEQQPERPPPDAQLRPDAAGEAMIASALSDRWVDAAASLEESGSSGGSVPGWAASSAGSELLRSVCESAPAACPIEISAPAGLPDSRTASLPAGVRLNPPAASARPETIQELEPQETQEAQKPQQQEPQMTQEQGERQGATGAVSRLDALSALPPALRRRLRESLERLPESRQRQLAADLTGRRAVQPFWDRLSASASSVGVSRMSALLLDQQSRPAGVGLLADSLDGMLRVIKVSAGSSAQADGMGAQAVKHALCLLRDSLKAEEAAGSAQEQERGAGQEAVLQEEARQEATRQEAARQEAVSQEAARQETISQETVRQEAARQEAAGQETISQETVRQEAARQEAAGQETISQETVRQEAVSHEAIRQETARMEAARQAARHQTPPQQEGQEEAVCWEGVHQEHSYHQQQQQAPHWQGIYQGQHSQQQQQQQQQQSSYQQQQQQQQQQYHQQQQSPPPGGEQYSEGGWLAGLAGLLPDGVLNMLRHSQRRGERRFSAAPTEAEALMISRLVEMGFFDVDRMRELYRQFGDDCNLIAAHLLDAEP